MNKKYKNRLDSGFTFVETLAVLAVTAVLTSQVSFGAFKLLQKAKVSAVISQIESFKLALQSYYIDCGNFPTQEQGLSVLWELSEEQNDRWNGPYVDKKIGKDPWGNEYVYLKEDLVFQNNVPSGLPFGIISYGADGLPGGTGNEKDICSWQ